MAAKKKSRSWDDLGEEIGQKIGKEMERGFSKAHNSKQSWCMPSWIMMPHHEHGGGFGRLLFIIGLIWALNTIGWMPDIGFWPLALIMVGFTLMRF